MRIKSFIIFGWCILGAGCVSTNRASGFLEDYHRLIPGAFFAQEFIAPDVDFRVYRKLLLEPISFKRLRERYRYSQEALDQIDAQFSEELREQLATRYQIISQRNPKDPQILTLIISLTRYSDTRPPLKEAALEAKIIDASNGKTLAEVAEKRSMTGDILHAWAAQFRDLLGYARPYEPQTR